MQFLNIYKIYDFIINVFYQFVIKVQPNTVLFFSLSFFSLPGSYGYGEGQFAQYGQAQH